MDTQVRRVWELDPGEFKLTNPQWVETILIVSHEGRRHEIAFRGAALGHEMSYAAFYADCEHEVRPVQKGYQLCLTYNLTLARPGGKTAINAPVTGPVVESIGALLGDWPSNGQMQKVAVALEHQYSQDGLRIDTLKGVDRTRAEVLFDAAKRVRLSRQPHGLKTCRPFSAKR